MPIIFRCERCNHRYQVREEMAGKKGKCKNCGAPLLVPRPESVPDAASQHPQSQIYRHQERKRDFELAFGDPDLSDAICEHVQKRLGEVDIVYHEMISDLVHIDVHRIPPRDDHPWITLFTTGMSAKPMTPPDELDDYYYAELLLHLPPEWPLEMSDFEDENNYWPIRLLKMLARLPHEFETWLAYGHTVPNGDPPEPYASNTEFSCALLMEPVLGGEGMSWLDLDDERRIYFWMVMPLYPEETDCKLRRGTEELITLFNKNEISPVIDLQRTNVCRKKKRFGWF